LKDGVSNILPWNLNSTQTVKMDADFSSSKGLMLLNLFLNKSNEKRKEVSNKQSEKFTHFQIQGPHVSKFITPSNDSEKSVYRGYIRHR
jgi:hypothetical protein